MSDYPPLPEPTDDLPLSEERARKAAEEKQTRAKRLADRFKAPEIDAKPKPPPFLVATGERVASRSEVVIPLGIPGMLAATGGTGKTWALLQLAASVATAHKWFGFSVTPGRVLYIAGEESTELLSERLWHIANGWSEAQRADLRRNLRILSWDDDDTAEDFTPTFIQRDRDLDRWTPDPVVGSLREALTEHPGEPWRLIVVDPASRFAGDSEKDSSAATTFVEAVRSIARRVNGPDSIDPTIIVAHHTRKPGKDAQAGLWLPKDSARGSSGLVDGARFLLTMQAIAPRMVPGSAGTLRSDDTEAEGSAYCTLQVAKSNHGAVAGVTRRVLKRADSGVLERAMCGDEPVEARAIGKPEKPDTSAKPAKPAKPVAPVGNPYAGR